MSPVQDFIMEHVTAKAQQSKSKSKSKTMEEFIKSLDNLIARFERRHYEQTLFSFMSDPSLTDVPAKSLSRLQQLMLFLPPSLSAFLVQFACGAMAMEHQTTCRLLK